MTHKRTGGGNGGYWKKKKVSYGNPRTPKPGYGTIGPDPCSKRPRDGTRANAITKKRCK